MLSLPPAKARLAIVLAGALCACTEPPTAATTDAGPDPWRARLNPEQFHVLREGGTEPPSGPAYAAFAKHGNGDYHCAGCDSFLFSSLHRFESHSGWPAFFDLTPASRADLRDSTGYLMPKEVVCMDCSGHLGHLFLGEGHPTPTDMRYCINAVALQFKPASH